MASWGEIERDAPDLAADARNLLEAHIHMTIATLRADGSPRISGIEAKVIGEVGIGDDLWFGSMPGSRKSADLARDPRFSLHSGSVRKLTVTRPTEAKDELAIAWWTEAGGVRRVKRK